MLNINFEAVYLIKLYFIGAIIHKCNTSTAYDSGGQRQTWVKPEAVITV